VWPGLWSFCFVSCFILSAAIHRAKITDTISVITLCDLEAYY